MESPGIMQPIRVGVIGAGAAAEGIHLPALGRTAGVEIAAIVDPAADRLEYVRNTFRVPAAFREYCRAMLPLTRALHERRQKEEVFSPVWDKSR